MNHLKFILMTITAFTTASAWSALSHEELAQSESKADRTTKSIDIAWDGIYAVSHDQVVIPTSATFDDQEIKNIHQEPFRLFKGEPVAIQYVGNEVTLTFTPQLEEDVDGTSPQHMVLTREQVAKMGLKLIGRGTPAELPFAE